MSKQNGVNNRLLDVCGISLGQELTKRKLKYLGEIKLVAYAPLH